MLVYNGYLDRLTNSSWYCLITGSRLMSCGSSIIAVWKAAASLINFPMCEGATSESHPLAADYHACRGELSPRSIVSNCLRLFAESLEGGEGKGEGQGEKWTRVLAHFLHFGIRGGCCSTTILHPEIAISTDRRLLNN